MKRNEALIPSLPHLEKENLYFVGWYLDQAYTEAFDLETMPAQNLTLYGKYLDASQPLTVTYTTPEDDVIEERSLTLGSTVELFVPQREGYLFTTWYMDQALTEVYHAGQIFDHLTLYSGWIQNFYEYSELSNMGECFGVIHPYLKSFETMAQLQAKQYNAFKSREKDKEMCSRVSCQ